MKIRKILLVLTVLAAWVTNGVLAQGPQNVLVVYYSRTGNTQEVAERLAQKFNADIERIIDRKKRVGPIAFVAAGKDALAGNLTQIEPLKRNPQDYDLILIGTPSWYSHMTPAIRTFVSESDLSGKQVGVFATAHLTGVETALDQLAAFINPEKAESIPKLPLRKRDLEDDVLNQKIESFFQQFNAKRRDNAQ